MAKFQHKKLSDFLHPSQEVADSFRKSGKGIPRKKKSSEEGQLFDFLTLIKTWDKIVGTRAANYSLPLKFTSGVLTILCSHPAWSKELAMLEQDLKVKIKKHFPVIATGLKNLKFITGPGELQRLRETLLKGHENSSIVKENFQRLHPHSPHYKKMKSEAETFLEMAGSEEALETDLKELLISLIIQLKQT